MLEFWFNRNNSKLHKLLFLVIAIFIAITLHYLFPMPINLTLLFIGAGVIFLICRFCKIHITKNNPKELLYRVFTWIPLAFLCAIIFTHATQNILDWGIQGIVQMIITICILSIHHLFIKK